jgi:hypothetical protein
MQNPKTEYAEKSAIYEKTPTKLEIYDILRLENGAAKAVRKKRIWEESRC